MDSGTIFLELIGLGYPCFLIKKDFWNFSKKFNKHLNNLKKINIIFNTVEDLNFFLKTNLNVLKISKVYINKYVIE